MMSKFDSTEKVLFGLMGACIAALVVGTAFYAVAESNEPDSGIVTVLDYRASYLTIVCSGGSTNVCTNVTTPDCWEVTYVNDGEVGDECVTEGEYRTYAIGDHFPKGKTS